MIEGINPKGTWSPRGRGFSMAAAPPTGQAICFTGQVVWDENETIIGVDDIRAQTHQCFKNTGAILDALGGKFEDIVEITTYFTDRTQLPIIQQVRSEFLDPENPPASPSVMVAGLGHPDFLVERTPVAVIPLTRLRKDS